MARAGQGRRARGPVPLEDGEPSPTYVQLAGDALLEGMTRERVVAALISRVKRDEGYLAYRKACGRRTGYDEQVRTDMRALALAAVLLEEREGAAGRGHERSQADAPPTTRAGASRRTSDVR